MDDVPARVPRPLTADMLETREDFERGMSMLPPVTIALIFLCVAIHVRVMLMGPALAEEAVYLPGRMDTALVLAGQWRRLFSAVFLHASPSHLLGNMGALFILGMGCEHAFGRGRTLALYLAAGLAGNVAGLARAGTSVGASGAIFGLMGLLAASLHLHRDRMVVRDRRLPVVLLVWAVYALLTGMLSPEVDNMAHAGGLVAGLIAGRILVPRALAKA